MIILVVRTDKPEAEAGLYDNTRQLVYERWQAHRQLAETLHARIKAVLQKAGKKLKDLDGIIVFAGPGSFTGLRIGISVANALAYSLDIPIVATTTEQWIEEGQRLLQQAGKPSRTPVLPLYGMPPHLTPPRK